jgi:hypothetical protein
MLRIRAINPILMLAAGILVGAVAIFAAAPALVPPQSSGHTVQQYTTVTSVRIVTSTTNNGSVVTTVTTTATKYYNFTSTTTNTTTSVSTVKVPTYETTTETLVTATTQTVDSTVTTTATKTITYTTTTTTGATTTSTPSSDLDGTYVFQTNKGTGNSTYSYTVPASGQMYLEIQLTPKNSSESGALYWNTFAPNGNGTSAAGQAAGSGLKTGFATQLNPGVKYTMVVDQVNENWQISLENCGVC